MNDAMIPAPVTFLNGLTGIPLPCRHVGPATPPPGAAYPPLRLEARLEDCLDLLEDLVDGRE